MSIERHGAVTRSFVTTAVPWLVGVGGFLLYLLTLNSWVSLESLGTTTQVLGTWEPQLNQPLGFIVLYPFRWLPGPWIPSALNAFTAVCAALVLMLLARSIALLPHDLAPGLPSPVEKPAAVLTTSTAWLPPVLTVILCGLQLSFWEHATSASGEMLNLLLFAYAIRCLLEYRFDRNVSWLCRCVFVYALGMTNSWVLVGYSPILFAALVRSRGLRIFLEVRLLVRLALWGLAGLSLYLVLPLIHGLSPESQFSFLHVLKLNLASQLKNLLVLRMPELKILVLASLLPVMIISIQWESHKAQAGDDSALGVFLARTTGHLVHALFILIAIWIGLDPSFSPRRLELGPSMLTCYYLSALVFGYCLGYFLLLESDPRRRIRRVPAAACWVLLLILPAGLLWRNLGALKFTNGPALREFARQLYNDLPAGETAVLSEDRPQMQILQVELRSHAKEKDPLLLQTLLLSYARYQMCMADYYGPRWPFTQPPSATNVLSHVQLRRAVLQLANRQTAVYLHPSSGLLTEPFHDVPQGLVYVLAPYRRDEPGRSWLSEAIVLNNERLWNERWTNLLAGVAAVVEEAGATRGGPWNWLLLQLRLSREQNATAAFLAKAYSKRLNSWGVELQRLGRWSEAGAWFDRALRLYPENLSASINLLFNQQHQHGKTARLEWSELDIQLRNSFAQYEDWPAVLNANGPVDEPTFLLRTGQVMLPGGNFRQAIRAFQRSAELAPNWPAPRLWLARLFARQGRFDISMAMTDEILSSGAQLQRAGLVDFLFCRALALRGVGRTNEAARLIEDYTSRYGDIDEILVTAAALYGQSRELDKQLKLLEEVLRRDPGRVQWLAMKGLVQLQLRDYDAALATVNKALSMEPANEQFRLHRAVASLGAGQLDAAKEDYLDLMKSRLRSYALFGLGEIAWRDRDTNRAMEYYREFLLREGTNALQSAYVHQRLKVLECQ